jgi:predicted AlkP superfamily pyrophosphatase or phosphodiesterase
MLLPFAVVRRRGALTGTLAAAVLAALACRAAPRADSASAPAPAAAPVADGPAARPTLVVLVAVDQLRADYFRRWEGQLTGGLARFWRQAAFFTDGRQDHALTETAPGHSTMLSGRWPARTGIVANLLGVQDPSSPLVGAKGEGASPERFRGSTLADWMRAADPATRILSVSRKDRGAILPLGRAKGQVFWYAGGTFTTSAYYMDTLPRWVNDFAAPEAARRLAGTTWTLLLPDSAYPEPDSVAFEHGGTDVAFPHRLTPNPDAAVVQLQNFPVMDSLTLAFALRGAGALGLGTRAGTDLLVVSLSTTDAVGHAYGPDSRELHDQVLHLDRWLGAFLDSLAVLVPRERTLLVLTADHGVTSYPEWTRTHGADGGAADLGDIARRLNEGPGRGLRTPFQFESGLLFGDVAGLRGRGVNVDSLAEALGREAAARPGVARVYTPASLAAAPAADPEATLWRRTVPADFGWLLCASLAPGWIWNGGTLAMHGSTHLDDQRVPIAFLGQGLAAHHYDQPASTTDIAPTLAALLGLRPAEPLDGHPLAPVVAGARR